MGGPLMVAVVHPQTVLTKLRQPAALKRALIAGAAWGVMLTIALTALAAWQCGGVICIDEAVWLGGISTATGILTIGPIAAFGRPDKG
jgi:hypothetical protein